MKTFSCRINLLFLVALGFICLPAIAQDVATAAASGKEAPAATLPSAPKALMLLAAKTNGLTGDDVKPWHMKASYTAYGQTGKHHGTYEEFWGSPRRFKVVITDSKSSQTEYGTEDGVFVAGKLSELPDESAAVEELLSNPVVVESGDAAVVEQRMEKYGTTEFRCLYNDTPADAITFEVTERLMPALSESHSPRNLLKND